MANRGESQVTWVDPVNTAEFERYFPVYRPVILAIARKLAGSDDDLVEDLRQEGAIALWSLELSNVRSNQDAWIRQAVKFRMIDALRRDNPRRYESLDQHLEAHEQLVRLPTGETILVSRTRTRRTTAWELEGVDGDDDDDE